jgi:LPXTG-motif cell wall-anchored protein
MKNSVLYIVGGIVLVGGGAFLYMKYKKKPQGDLATQTDSTGATTTGATTTGAGVTETENADDIKKLSEATEIAKQIDAINKKINALNSSKNAQVQSFGFGQSAYTRNVMLQQQINNENKKRVPLVDKLTSLGYSESNGLPIKTK